MKLGFFLERALHENDNGWQQLGELALFFSSIKTKPQSNKNKQHFHLFLVVVLFLKQGKSSSVEWNVLLLYNIILERTHSVFLFSLLIQPPWDFREIGPVMWSWHHELYVCPWRKPVCLDLYAKLVTNVRSPDWGGLLRFNCAVELILLTLSSFCIPSLFLLCEALCLQNSSLTTLICDPCVLLMLTSLASCYLQLSSRDLVSLWEYFLLKCLKNSVAFSKQSYVWAVH